MRGAVGFIEVKGLVGAIEAADVAAKAANVSILGLELAKGSGLVTVKIEGEVSAVKAAVDTGVIAANRVGLVFSKNIIARPNEETYRMISNEEKEEKKEAIVEQAEEILETVEKEEVVEKEKNVAKENTGSKKNKK